jgi:uncharacterized protein YydD (DUF2326 family)
MLAIKENRQYTITDSEVISFQKEGYDIYNEDGTIHAYGFGKSVPYEKYAKLMEQVETMQEEILSLEEEILSMKQKVETPKKSKKKD